MKKTYKLKGWVKVVLTIILLGVAMFCYTKAGEYENNARLTLTYWLFFLLTLASSYIIWEK